MITQALDLANRFKQGLAARRRVEVDFFGNGGHDTGDTFMGYQIIQWEDLCTAQTGNDDPMALILAGRNFIFVNASLLALPKEVKEGILAHEVGHLKLDHKPSSTYTLEAYFGFGKGIKLECEADEYALANGYNPLGYLNHMREHGYNNRAILKRIKNIRKLTLKVA